MKFKYCLSGLIMMLFVFMAHAQTTKATSSTPPRPKIIVGMMVDQMRWDYL